MDLSNNQDLTCTVSSVVQSESMMLTDAFSCSHSAQHTKSAQAAGVLSVNNTCAEQGPAEARIPRPGPGTGGRASEMQAKARLRTMHHRARQNLDSLECSAEAQG